MSPAESPPPDTSPDASPGGWPDTSPGGWPDASPAAPPGGWLGAEEMRAWRSLHTVLVLLPMALDRQLQKDTGVSLLEYYVLAGLSLRASGSARLSEIAFLTNAELSRVSHLTARLEKRGLVRRRPDPGDGRFTEAQLTAAGRELVSAAAPGHAATVRKLIFADLDGADLDALTRATDRMVAALADADLPITTATRRALRLDETPPALPGGTQA